MRTLLLCLLTCTSVSYAFAQNNEDHFNLGLGLNNGWGIPISGTYDWGFRQDFNLGVGLSVGLDVDDGQGSETALGAGFFTQWYADRILEIPSSLDVYAGLGVFYYTRDSADDLDLNLFIGGRYYFNETLGVNLELGGGTVFSGGRVGLSWRL